MWTSTDCVYKNSFRKVKLSEKQIVDEHKTVAPCPCLTHEHSFGWSHSLFSPTSAWRRKAYCTGKEGYAATQGN